MKKCYLCNKEIEKKKHSHSLLVIPREDLLFLLSLFGKDYPRSSQVRVCCDHFNDHDFTRFSLKNYPGIRREKTPSEKQSISIKKRKREEEKSEKGIISKRIFQDRPSVIKLREDEKNVSLSLKELRTDFTCPICLGFIKSAMAVTECMHRFCEECITCALRWGNKECPKCRAKCPAKRHLRRDLNFDQLLCTIIYDPELCETETMKTIQDQNKQKILENTSSLAKGLNAQQKRAQESHFEEIPPPQKKRPPIPLPKSFLQKKRENSSSSSLDQREERERKRRGLTSSQDRFSSFSSPAHPPPLPPLPSVFSASSSSSSLSSSLPSSSSTFYPFPLPSPSQNKNSFPSSSSTSSSTSSPSFSSQNSVFPSNDLLQKKEKKTPVSSSTIFRTQSERQQQQQQQQPHQNLHQKYQQHSQQKQQQPLPQQESQQQEKFLQQQEKFLQQQEKFLQQQEKFLQEDFLGVELPNPHEKGQKFGFEGKYCGVPGCVCDFIF